MFTQFKCLPRGVRNQERAKLGRVETFECNKFE